MHVKFSCIFALTNITGLGSAEKKNETKKKEMTN